MSHKQRLYEHVEPHGDALKVKGTHMTSLTLQELTPEEILEHWPTHGALWLMEEPQLFEKHLTNFILAVMSCKDTPEHQILLEDVAKPSAPMKLRKSAAFCAIPHVLEYLAADQSWELRTDVARNKNTPAYILLQLSEDINAIVRKEVAINKNTPSNALLHLAKDKSIYIRQEVAQNNNTPVDALSILASDKNFYVRQEVAQNNNTPVDVLSILASDKNFYVRLLVAGNKNVSSEILSKLAKDKVWDVRSAVIKSGNTTTELLREIALKDKDKNIRRLAEETIELKNWYIEK